MKNKVALFRLSVLGSLTSRIDVQHGELKKLIQAQAQQQFDIPNSKKTKISARTIGRWYRLWKKHGVDGLEPKVRKDRGNCKLSEEAKSLILKFKEEDMRRSLTTLLDLISRQGFKNLPRSSVHRFLQTQHMSKRVISDAPTIERRQFLAQYSNEIWYGDVMHGPKIMTENGLKKVYLITIIDDASRLVAHSEFALNEQAVSIEKVLKEAVMRRGLPNRLIVDNGSAYKSSSLHEICARLEIHLIHCRPYEPEAKGKLERWHRTVRDQFINELNFSCIKNLEDINLRILAWVEEVYHRHKHSSLDTQTPLQRYRKDMLRIRLLGEKAKHIDEIFYHRIKRHVKKTGVLNYNGKEYEVPYQYASTYVNLVIDPYLGQAKYLESLKGEKIADVTPLNAIQNTYRDRQRPTGAKPPGKAKSSSVVEDALEAYQNRFKLEDK